MVDIPPTSPSVGKTGNFLSQSTAGLPNWAWLLVIVGGIAAAILIPKFLPGRKTAADTTAPGLGLALDPTSGLPYAVEGLVPAGGLAGGGGGGNPPPLPTPPLTFPIQAMTRSEPGLPTIIVKRDPDVNSPELPHVPAGVPVWITGPAIVDKHNIKWYPLQGGGYIFGYDLIFQTNTGSTQWP